MSRFRIKNLMIMFHIIHLSLSSDFVYVREDYRLARPTVYFLSILILHFIFFPIYRDVIFISIIKSNGFRGRTIHRLIVMANYIRNCVLKQKLILTTNIYLVSVFNN